MKRWVSGPMKGNPPLAIRGSLLGTIVSKIKSAFGTKTPLLPAPKNKIKYVNAGTKGLKRLSSSSKAATRNALLNP